MTSSEIKAAELDAQRFIDEEVARIAAAVGDGTAVNALSGGVDSCVVTLLGHRALGARLKTYMIDNGLMRQGEPEQVVELFAKPRREGGARRRTRRVLPGTRGHHRSGSQA
jgi:GMP synthase (glutamine-hydrolysing)